MWAVAAVLAGTVATAAAQDSSSTTSGVSQGQAAYAITQQYVFRFYPRFMTAFMQSITPENLMITPIYPENGLLTNRARIVNALNVDTVYGSAANVNVAAEPVILTLPNPVSTFSMLTLDLWGQAYSTGISNTTGGTYALTLTSWHGTLPPGVTRVNLPAPSSIFLIRSDRYSKNASGDGYVNTVDQSKAFIAGIRLRTLSKYLANHSAGRVVPVPQAALAASTTVAANTIRTQTSAYLRGLQEALRSPNTVLTASDRALIAKFDSVFAQANHGVAAGNYGEMQQINNAAQDADRLIQDHYRSHYLPGTKWINFNDLAAWGNRYLDRDATTSFIFLGNNAATARYWDALVDSNGSPLNTDTYPLYTMTFSKNNFPESRRFWSVTAYIGDYMENSAVGNYIEVPPGPSNHGQRNVAAYTPGLFHNPNGSVTIFIGPHRPRNPVLRRNWIRVPAGDPFALVIRSYGPEGNTACPTQDDCKTYVPPPIKPLGVLGG